MVLSVGQMSRPLCRLCKKVEDFSLIPCSLRILRQRSTYKCNTPSDVMYGTLVVEEFFHVMEILWEICK
jgi:hypothetical protein